MFHRHDLFSMPAADTGRESTGLNPTFGQHQQSQASRRCLGDFLAAIHASHVDNEASAFFDRYWSEEQDAWLQQLPSEHTRRAYSHSLLEFRTYLQAEQELQRLWQVEPRHAVGWIEYMREIGSALRDDPEPLSDRTVNLRLAALSSFYEHMTSATRLVHGHETGLFVDVNGTVRDNPFRSTRVKRPSVVAYETAIPAPQHIMKWILNRLRTIQPKTLAHQRDYALLMTFCYTGYRVENVLAMRWGDFRPRGDGDGVVHRLTVKGGKGRRKHLPKQVWDAILAYLNAEGRYDPSGAAPDDDMFIWLGIRGHGGRNLVECRLVAAGHDPDEAREMACRQQDSEEQNKPIARSTANEILRRHLRRYYAYELHRDGLSKSEARVHAKRLATAYHLHSLRHTFASTLDEASDGDVRLISDMLDHASVKTTRTYLKSIRDPQDRTTLLLEQAYGL